MDDLTPEECEAFGGIFMGNGTTCDTIDCPVLDQIHVFGPVPNSIMVGATGSITSTVEANFAGMPNQNVLFTTLQGNLAYTNGDVSLDGTEATAVTDNNGQVAMTILANGPGLALIKVTTANEIELSAFSFFEIVAPPAPLLGDINGDGVIDGNDTNLFIAVLLGTDADPAHVTASDCNGDGTPDGKDIQVFVSSLAGP